jgi:hypothetical protein
MNPDAPKDDPATAANTPPTSTPDATPAVPPVAPESPTVPPVGPTGTPAAPITGDQQTPTAAPAPAGHTAPMGKKLIVAVGLIFLVLVAVAVVSTLL